MTIPTCGMVILSVHFDESQMFSLLGDIRGHGVYRKVPVLCVLGERGRLSEVAVEGLDNAVKAMTANGFLDLDRFSDDDKGNARIRRIVDYLILIDGDLQAISEVQELGRVTERRLTSKTALKTGSLAVRVHRNYTERIRRLDRPA